MRYLIVFVLSGLLSACASACAPGLALDADQPVEDFGEHKSVPFRDGTLHYVEAGTVGGPLMLFIHGTPGSWDAFKAYLKDERLQDYHLIAMDRPGFGQSANLGPMPAFADQAAAAAALLALNQSAKGALVIGHSLGGSISYRVAIDYTDQVGGVVAISSAADPALSKPRWYNHAARIPPVWWLLPKGLRTANREMMPLARELEAMTEALTELQLPVTIIQGAKDPLVKGANVDYAKALMNQAQVSVRYYDDEGHFIVWDHHDDVVDELLRSGEKL